MQARKVTRIRLEHNPEENLAALGIVSAEPDYKLTLSINRKLGLSLKNINPLTLTEKESEIAYSRFKFTDEQNERVVILASNRENGNYLVKKLRNIDFIFLIEGEASENDLQSLISSLREIGIITAVFILGSEIIRDKNIQALLH